MLENILEQSLSSSHKLQEIIVVSSGSTDGTDDIVGKFTRKDCRIKLISESSREGKASALNTILRHAKGDMIAIVSADTKPAKNALAKLADSMTQNIGGVCARTRTMAGGPTIMAFCGQYLWNVSNRLLCMRSKNHSLAHLGGDMWAIRKGIVKQIPSDVINDDAYIGTALKRKGWQILFIPDAEVTIAGPATPLEYIQQRERIIIGHKQVKEKIGIEPSTIGALAFKQPLLSLTLLASEARTGSVTSYPKIIIGLFLEILAQSLARINYRKRNQYLKWKQIRTTKSFQ